jgi:hypothetical protein
MGSTLFFSILLSLRGAPIPSGPRSNIGGANEMPRPDKAGLAMTGQMLLFAICDLTGIGL